MIDKKITASNGFPLDIPETKLFENNLCSVTLLDVTAAGGPYPRLEFKYLVENHSDRELISINKKRYSSERLHQMKKSFRISLSEMHNILTCDNAHEMSMLYNNIVHVYIAADNSKTEHVCKSNLL